MTPGTFNLVAEGYFEREKSLMHKLAWHAANVIQPWTKQGRSIRPSDLLPEDLAAEMRGDADEELKQFDEAASEIGALVTNE